MEKIFKKMLSGYLEFRKKYALDDKSIMRSLSTEGQQPHTMIVACCDSRVDPALILQCDPGDLFVVRNVANIVPPFEKKESYHGTGAALEFGICFLKVKHLILLGHSQCGGIKALLNNKNSEQNDFISNWVSLIKPDNLNNYDADDYAKLALKKSHENCLSYPWVNEKVLNGELVIHMWFFDIESGQIFTHIDGQKAYKPL